LIGHNKGLPQGIYEPDYATPVLKLGVKSKGLITSYKKIKIEFEITMSVQ